jgi:DNA-binding response OmpR family regulator
MKKNILVIEDDESILTAMKFTLEYEGYSVVITDKGEYVENLKHGKNKLPDLIILDVLLSGKDGRVICKELKSKKQTKHIPIIMMSAHPGAEKSVNEIGANNFLAKPFDIDVLLEMVKEYI